MPSEPMGRDPKKAYYVQRVSRCVTLVKVYADSAKDAKARSAMEGDAVDTQYEPRGFGRVWREPDEDR